MVHANYICIDTAPITGTDRACCGIDQVIHRFASDKEDSKMIAWDLIPDVIYF